VKQNRTRTIWSAPARIAGLTVLVLGATASIALAATFVGTSGPDTYGGTPQNDLIRGLGGADHLSSAQGNDEIGKATTAPTSSGAAVANIIEGGDGSDTIITVGPQGEPEGADTITTRILP